MFRKTTRSQGLPVFSLWKMEREKIVHRNKARLIKISSFEFLKIL